MNVLFFVSLHPYFLIYIFTMTQRCLSLLFMSALFAISLWSATAKNIPDNEVVSLGQKAYYLKSLTVCPYASDDNLKEFFFVEEAGTNLLAVLNFEHGFLVMAADDASIPVLAYGFNTQLSQDNMAPGARMFLQQYQNEIRMLRRMNIEPDSRTADLWEELRNDAPKTVAEVVVAPLLSSKWNQTKYYNRYSPLDAESSSAYDFRTPNGCVAVAMAQICYYYRYPLQGTGGSHTNHTDYGNFTVNFSQAHYNYDVMLDQLSWYNHEVANLIFNCATSVNMMYAPSGSGAYSTDVPDAMKQYFGYSSNAQYISKYSYNNTSWRNALKNELDAGRPLYYSGFSDEGGHAFVCDGYNTDNYFHFNFGWGGSSDGYYALTSSVGATNPVGGYSDGQAAIINLYPADNMYPYTCSSRTIQSTSGTLEDGSANDNYPNNASCTYLIVDDSAYSYSIMITAFETEAGHDSLSFWDGDPANGHLLGTLSGSIPYGTYYDYITDSLYITFKTDGNNTDAGWRFEYYVNRHLPSCTTGQTHDAAGTISDGSGAAHYRANANCFWMIRIADATEITFTFDTLDLAIGDEVVFYDISTVPRTWIASYTGNNIPAPFTIESGKVMVKFISDNYIDGDGFVLSWTSDAPFEPGETLNVHNYSTDAMTLIPNPATHSVRVKVPAEFASASISVMDITGRQVSCSQSVVDANGDASLDVSHLTEGIYFVTCQNESRICQQKLIVRR